MTATTIPFADSKSANNVTAKKNNLNIAIIQYVLVQIWHMADANVPTVFGSAL